MLIVGLGGPKQELWVHTHRREIAAPVAPCVWRDDRFSGRRASPAPVWMRRTGLEWVHRLASEPGRLGGVMPRRLDSSATRVSRVSGHAASSGGTRRRRSLRRLGAVLRFWLLVGALACPDVKLRRGHRRFLAGRMGGTSRRPFCR